MNPLCLSVRSHVHCLQPDNQNEHNLEGRLSRSLRSRNFSLIPEYYLVINNTHSVVAVPMSSIPAFAFLFFRHTSLFLRSENDTVLPAFLVLSKFFCQCFTFSRQSAKKHHAHVSQCAPRFISIHNLLQSTCILLHFRYIFSLLITAAS